MMESILRILGGLVPDHTADPEVQYRYQLRLGLTMSIVVASVLGLGAITAAAFGLTPWSQGFARQADVQTNQSAIVKEIRQNRAQSVDASLLDLRIKHCQAKDDTSRQLYWSRIAALMQEYQRLTGQTWPLPSCSDL